MFNLRTLLLVAVPFILFSCKETGVDQKPDTAPVDLTKHVSPTGVMMQAFYWDVEPRGEWWNTVSSKVEGWKKIGVDRIWLPPASKGMSGGNSMGYDPMDYFDLGEYDQMGTVETRFGSRTELEGLISKAHQNNIQVIADIVLNHNSGGALEFNPYRQKNTYTLFQPKSGRFFRNHEHFHPNGLHKNDAEAAFFEEQDLCHDQLYVQRWLWQLENSVAQYYKNTLKFDGWRFDYVKGFDSWVIKAWMDAVGGYSVGELWDGNATTLHNWVKDAGSPAFDFAAFYAMENAIDGNNMTILRDRPQLWKLDPKMAVTFVNNHDTEKETNQGNRISTNEGKLLAYAYILTHEGYPCIFYSDYEQFLDKAKLDNLILINRSLAKGSTSVLHADNDLYVAQRNGEGAIPGLVVFLNNSNSAQTRQVTTRWKNATLYDYSGTTTKTITTDANGRATLEASAKGYSVWSLKNF
ncbi:alpha-amylase [Telluribacter sp. SYSU D00476]|uniref:alpha-amylase n=1 Tax=Telluribacter sp. SYSU D00476 TaxID=2811430 RepID=UPI001FF3F38F|nr:alpha-amylase [Telluribacter sp. SYSU D00476]